MALGSSRLLAVVAVATVVAGPLAHAPAFRQSFGQQVLAEPYGVALAPDGDVWVADTGHDRVAEFTPSGHLVASLHPATRLGGLDQPEGITLDAAGHIFVADTGHNRVIEISRADRVLVTFGSGRGRLDQPVAVAVSSFGDVWVADQGHSRVVEFTADGRYHRAIGVPTQAGVALDALGNVWVSSPGSAQGNSVQEFSRPVIGCCRSAPPRRATVTWATSAGSRSGRPGRSTSRSRTTAWYRCSARPGASSPSSAGSPASPRRMRTWSSRRAWR